MDHCLHLQSAVPLSSQSSSSFVCLFVRSGWIGRFCIILSRLCATHPISFDYQILIVIKTMMVTVMVMVIFNLMYYGYLIYYGIQIDSAGGKG